MKSLSELRNNSDLLALGILFATMPVVAAIAPKLVFWCAILAVIMVALGRDRFYGHKALVRSKFAVILLSIIVWTGLSCLWSLDPWHSVVATIRLSLIVGAFFILIAASRRVSYEDIETLRMLARKGGWLGLFLAIAAVAIVIGHDAWSSYMGLNAGEVLNQKLNHFNRTAAVLVILAWPISAIMMHGEQPRRAIFFLCLVGMLCFILPSTALFISYIFGLSIFGIATLSLRLSRATLIFALIGYLACLPAIEIYDSELVNLIEVYINNPVAEIHRIKIWKFCLVNIVQDPLFGFGIDTSHKIPGGKDLTLLYTTTGAHTVTGPVMPLHPHSAPIQIWLELGLIGLLLTTILFIFLAFSIPSRATSQFGERTDYAMIGSCFVLAVLSFDIWQGWWLCTIFSTGIYSATFRDRKNT